MHERFPDLMCPCAFEVAHACQTSIGELLTGTLTMRDLPARFASVPYPTSQAGAMVAAQILSQFAFTLGREYHRRFHETARSRQCKFDPDACRAIVHVGFADWQMLDIARLIRDWADRYSTAFAAVHGRDFVTLAQARFADEADRKTAILTIAREFGCSQATFRRHFKAASGKRPIDGRTLARVIEGFVLLRTTPWKIETVARQIGWHGIRSIYRAFDRVIDTTPGEVRLLTASAAASLLERIGGDPARLIAGQAVTATDRPNRQISVA